jgi:hypothetical protein
VEEIFPVAAGVLVGLVTYRFSSVVRTALLAVLSLVLGFLAAWASGELAVSWVYVLIDALQVAVAAVMTGFAVKAWLRYRARSVAR